MNQHTRSPSDLVPFGGKDDSTKSDPSLLFEGCAPALAAVTRVLDFGARKYAANSWQQVPNGISRYKSAASRHFLQMQMHGWDKLNDEDWGLPHLDHLITDLLFIRTLLTKKARAGTAFDLRASVPLPPKADK